MNLTFTTTTDDMFYPGAVALVKSIRHFYTKEEADIFVYGKALEESQVKWLASMGAKFKKFVWNVDARKHGKAICTKGAMDHVDDGSILIHIDSDAWLLARLDPLMPKVKPNTLYAWNDKNGKGLRSDMLPKMFGYNPPKGFDPYAYNFNAGIVAYGMGTETRRLGLEFVDRCLDKECNKACGNQGIIRCLAAKFHGLGKIKFCKSDGARHWNPIWYEADNLEFKDGKWFNERDGEQQFIFHASGGKGRRIGKDKPWQRPEVWSKSTLAQLEWIESL